MASLKITGQVQHQQRVRGRRRQRADNDNRPQLHDTRLNGQVTQHAQQDFGSHERHSTRDPAHGNGGIGKMEATEQIHRMKEQTVERGGMMPTVAARTPPTSSSPRMALVQKKQNMMQRRIEMRRRNEERQRQLQRQQQQRQQEQVHQQEQLDYQQQQQHSMQNSQMPAQILDDQHSRHHPHENLQNQHHYQDLQHHHTSSQNQTRSQHFQQQTQPNPYSNFNHDSPHLHTNSIPANPPPQTKPSGNGNYYSNQQPKTPQYHNHPQGHAVVSPPEEPHQNNNYDRPPPPPQSQDQQYLYQQQQQEQHQQDQQQQQHGQYQRSAPSPEVPSPPMLQRRQHAHHNYNPGENPTTRLFDSNHSSEQMYGNGNTNYPHENYGGGDGNHGYYEHANRDSAITPKNSSLANMSSNIVSPHESPSDEGHGHADGFERNQRLDMGGNRLSNPDQRREQFEHQQHSQQQQQQQRQHQQQQHQQHSQNEHVMISGRPPMQGMKTRRVNYTQPQHHPPLQKPMPQPQPQQNQNQPDWHEINRQRLYQKQLASRQQQQRQNYGPHPPTNPSNQNANLQSQMMPNSQPPLNNNSAYSQRRQHPSYFSPVEALDKRTDQIQRKKKLFVPGPGPQEMHSGNATRQFRDQNHVQPPPNNSHGDIGEGEESVASVLDRVRSFDNNATSARGPQQNGREESRSRSLSRGSRPLQLQSNNSKERRNSNPQYSRNLHPPVRVTAPQNEFNRNRDVRSGQDPARQLIGQSPWRHSNQPTSQGPQKEIAPQYPSLLDEDTVVGSVASLKKEWEVRATSGQNQNQSHTMPAPADNDGPNAFGGWGERANRLTQLRRQDQRRNTVDERSRRNVGRSLPPESRSHRHGGDQGGRFVNPDGERHHDGYQSDGPSCRQQGQNNVADERDSEPMSVKDVRSRLWDQNERLRAVLPTAASFESIGDVRKRWPDNSNSPGNMSGSTGSSLFKSKFVHAAAMAARQRANLDDVGKQKRELGSKQHNQKGVAASSHYTDSTAETTAITTPLGSYSSSYRVHSTVSRMADHSNGYHQRYPRQTNDHKFAAPSTYPVQVLEENGDSKERIEDEVDFDTPSRSQKTSTMPPIAEANNSLVSDLIAKLNAVSRANPADALAAIDSILQAEGGRAAFPKPIPISAPKKNLAPARPVAADRPSNAMRRPLGKDCFQEQSNDVFHDMLEHNDDPDDESCVSSDDSTVSSMTNPTYLSMTETAKRHLSKGGVSNSQKISPHAQSNFVQKRSFTKERQPQPTESEYYDNNNSSSINNTKKQPTAKEISPAVAYRNTPSHTGSHASRLASVEDDRKSNADESAWEYIPQNKYFSSAKGKSHAQSKERDTHQGSAQDRSSANEGGRISTTLNKTNDSQRHQEHPGETRFRKLKTAPQQNQSKPNPRLTSFPETEDDRLSALPHVVSDAFSNVDISLDEANPISSSVPTQSYSIDEPQSSLQTISQAFSDVNISLEHDKTVSQRRQELEYLSKSWTDKTSSDSTDRASNANADERLEIAPSWLTNNDKKYGNQAAQTSKLKKTMEPKLRLKGSKKLTQKFASLIKAFEDDEY